MTKIALAPSHNSNDEPEKRAKPMRIRAIRLIFCLAAACVSASCAGSNSGSSGPKISAVDQNFLRGISSYDQNRDGVVTCDEWRGAAAGSFTKANKSGTGFLTEAEFRNLAASDRTFLVATSRYYDANGDGKIDRQEFVERPNPAFTLADTDKDCRLTESEQLTARNLSAPSAEPVRRPSAIGTGAPSGAGSRY